MYKVKLYSTLSVILFLLLTSGCKGSAPPDEKATNATRPAQPGDFIGCALEFEGEDRKAVKLRDPRQLNYRTINSGKPISVAQWFGYVCAFDENIPARRRLIPQDQAMEMENHRVTLRAYVLAVRREDDNDFHVQVGDRRQWEQEQIVVEVPPGASYCEARTAITELMQADGAKGGEKTYIFRQPPRATFTGFVFLDSAHLPADLVRSDYCRINGNRGIRQGLSTSPVRGLWEIHPVFKVEANPLSALTRTRPSPSPAIGSTEAPMAGQLIGNKNSKVYHRPDCPDYHKVSAKNRVYFDSETEAEKAAFRKARNCP